jgi:hypothetical protein
MGLPSGETEGGGGGDKSGLGISSYHVSLKSSSTSEKSEWVKRITRRQGRSKEKDLPVNEMWGLDYYLPSD